MNKKLQYLIFTFYYLQLTVVCASKCAVFTSILKWWEWIKIYLSPALSLFSVALYLYLYPSLSLFCATHSLSFTLSVSISISLSCLSLFSVSLIYVLWLSHSISLCLCKSIALHVFPCAGRTWTPHKRRE